MENHILKLHNISPSPPTQAKIPSPPGRPYCRTCNKYIEEKISMADHCKLHHNLEISTNKSSPVSKIVKVPNAPAGQPTRRQVNSINKGKLKVSFGVLPSKPPGKSNSSTNSKTSKNGTQISRIFSSKDGSSSGGLTKKFIHDHQSDSSLEDFSIPDAQKHQNAQQGSPTKCPLCPFMAIKKGGLRIHMFRDHGKVVTHSEMSSWSSGTLIAASTSSMTTDEPMHQCTLCATVCKTAKGLRVHRQAAHKISVVRRATPEVTSSSLPFRCQCQSTVLRGSAIKSFALLNGTPINNSVKRHLAIYHRIQLAGVEYWCTICKRRISGKPASHPCLLNGMMSSQVASADTNRTTWVCSACGFIASSKVGLDVHGRVHKKESLANKGTPIVSLPTPKQRKQLRKKKIAPLLVGSPGDLPLDRPLPDFQVPTDITQEIAPEPTTEIPLIDLPSPNIIESFIEPLDALISEDIDDRLRLLEIINNDITAALQQHFHLKKRQLPSSNPGSSKNEKLNKLKDPQTIQKAYAWNRRKCIRDLVESNDTRCSVHIDDIYSHFSSTWAAPTIDSSPSFPNPPELPPIAESFTEDLVCECLKAAENTAPGPDLVTYKHWREADPKGRILTRLFNICLSLKKVPASWKQRQS
ncbi:c2H2-type domain-containing protein [Nephila pilipes]|uniref:C2H2-type domain-containing protein n=1 Tax=Nephila pilipes TaxID=299642 RepID=A0A8X6NDR6_NEPPI|nr:c2H2-type domain-containing protein [Nephila pilipes]